VATSESRCRCRICSNDPGTSWDDGDRQLVADVVEHGTHVLAIHCGGELPEYVFSVGMWHHHRVPEVAMFGLQRKDMHVWLNNVRHDVEQGRVFGVDQRTPDVIEGVDVLFRPVDPSWNRHLFGYMKWFYGEFPPVVQLVWPDRFGAFPWESDVGEACRTNQPVAWRPTTDQPEGPWSWLLVTERHGWPEPPDLVGYVSGPVASGESPVLGVYHDGEDDWCFVGESGATDLALMHVAHLVDGDPTLAQLADLGLGLQAWRSAVGDPWERSPFECEE